MKTIRACSSWVVVFAFVLATPTAAQETPAIDVSGGYQLLDIGGDVDETFGKGWYAEVAGNVTSIIGLVFNVGGSYKSLSETATINGVRTSATADLNLHQFMGGVRFNARTVRRVTPFGHVLAGGIRSAGDVSATVGGQSFAVEGGSDTNLGMVAGGGVDFMLTDNAGIRAGADYVRVYPSDDEDEGTNVVRIAVGAVFAFGRR